MKSKAQQALESLERARRADGTPYVRLEAGAPEWVTEVLRKAHARHLPDDTFYEAVYDILECLANGKEPVAKPPVSYVDLLDWVRNAPGAIAAVDRALRENVVVKSSLWELLTHGYVRWYDTIAEWVKRVLREIEEEEEE